MATQEASPLGPHATLPAGSDRCLPWACRETGPPEPPKLRFHLRTAKAIGFPIRTLWLQRADRIIQ